MAVRSTPMSALSLARRDRLGLCDLLDELGPDAPTLCEAGPLGTWPPHLVARDRRPDSVPGLVFDPLNGWSERVRRGEADRPYADLVTPAGRAAALVAARAPGLERLGNTHEFFVHFEDVRRAETGWTARTLDEAAEADLWKVLGWIRRRAFKAVPVGVVLNGRTGRRCAPRAATRTSRSLVRRASCCCTHSGARAAVVDLEEPADAVAALEAVERSW